MPIISLCVADVNNCIGRLIIVRGVVHQLNWKNCIRHYKLSRETDLSRHIQLR